MPRPAPELRDKGAAVAEAAGRPAPAAGAAAAGGAGRGGGAALAGNLPAALFFLLLLAAWQTLVTARHVSDFILPSPLAILRTTGQYFPLLLRHTWTTTYEIGLGFVIGNAIAVAMALLIVNSRLAEQTVYPLLIASQTIPKVAIAPLFLVWFGSGITPKVIITAVICFFPTVVNTVQGLKATDDNAIDLLRLVAASRLQVFTKLQFPNALPYFFAGLKISIALAVIGAIIGEWVGANSGLGYVIMYSTQTLRTDFMFAALLLVSALGIALYLVVVLLERLFSWRAAERPVGGL
jgi:ABC-type nitrate/sulfonate/bicarbonate transport system permease component